MARGRVYSIDFAKVSLTAKQDLFSIAVPSTMMIEIHSITLGQVTQTTIGALSLRLRRMPATFTQGSGGTSATPQPLLPNDAASACTCHVNDTTQATSGGTSSDMGDVWNLLNGYLWLPPIDDRPTVKVSQGFVVSLDDAPGAAITASGTLIFAELA